MKTNARHSYCFQVLVIVASLSHLRASPQDAGSSLEDARRQAAVADYTRQMQGANYPALFAKAAEEFHVPVDVLEGVSFAETRWTPLQWPPGETVSPDNGMPHPYGIMALWDNDYFGHTLAQAAALIGQTPEVLKTDTFQNMRGAAALLRQLYEAGAKPADAPGQEQLESWRYAVAKYTGIPQRDLSARHALRVYEFINQGYHQYGIEWAGQAVNLNPIRAEVAALMAQTQGQSPVSKVSNLASAPNHPSPDARQSSVEVLGAAPAPRALASAESKWPILLCMSALLIVLGFGFRKKPAR